MCISSTVNALLLFHPNVTPLCNFNAASMAMTVYPLTDEVSTPSVKFASVRSQISTSIKSIAQSALSRPPFWPLWIFQLVASTKVRLSSVYNWASYDSALAAARDVPRSIIEPCLLPPMIPEARNTTGWTATISSSHGERWSGQRS